MLKHASSHEDGAVDVLLLSTYDTDGAGKFTLQISMSLQKLGYSTRVISVRNRSNDSSTLGLLDQRPLKQAIYRLSQDFNRNLYNPLPEYAFIHMGAISDHQVVNSKVWPISCRLIICTFLSGMMSPSALSAIEMRYGQPPVIFYGVDMNFYTAGCHYARECEQYQVGCNNCPAVPYIARKRVQREFQAKSICYQSLRKPVVVSSSKEHHEQILSSALLGQYEVRKLLMSVNSAIYGKFEYKRNELRFEKQLIGRVMLVRSSAEPRKGCEMFATAMRILSAESPHLIQNLIVMAVGDHFVAERLKDSDVRVLSCGYISTEEELADFYTVADFFVNTSLADGGPVMLAQALMSGTPVISTDVGLARDLIQSKLSGHILERPTATDLANAIAKFCSFTDEKLQQMRSETHRAALECIGEENYLKALSGLIGEMIGEH